MAPKALDIEPLRPLIQISNTVQQGAAGSVPNALRVTMVGLLPQAADEVRPGDVEQRSCPA
jgi:hypothetical protein